MRSFRQVGLDNLETRTIVFDLEETLIHISMKTEDSDMVIPIKKKDGPATKVDLNN